ncbi:DNA-binding protein [Faecalibacterium taiwanense]|uniref:DNA-binding protein n=1 Tax=Faecalibacterium taiwanense TaxID=3030638 RepID=UPI003AAAC9E9
MLEYMTVQDAAKLWGNIGDVVFKSCVRRIALMELFGYLVHGLIPQDAQKPADGRYKQNKNEFIADNKENTR